MKKIIVLITAVVLVPSIIFAQAKPAEDAFETSKNLDIYYALFKEVSEYYVDPIEPGKLVKKSIDHMLDNLDPYTNYISEDDIEEYRFQTTGKYGGIGCAMRNVGDYIAIDEPYENSPAIKAGLKAGDIIIEIDGKSTKGLDDEAMRKLVKGSPGTNVKFKVRNPVTKVEKETTITREEIVVSNVTLSTLVGNNKDIALVRLNQFTDKAAVNIKTALDSLKKSNGNKLGGVIIDLRYNPGGLLDQAVDICNLFMSRDQLVVSTKGKVDEWIKEYKTINMAWDDKVPVVVMVNRGSASASEIVSGTLQDVDRAVVVGQKSFGKGLVQTTRPLPYNAKLKVTTAKYYTPSGRCIQALDYSHRNEDGSVGSVADSLKKEFKTANGRKVFDGGGVDPDIKVATKDASKLAAVLANKNYIFDYANEYMYKNNTIPDAAKFELTDTDLNTFFKWLEAKDYSYKTKSEEALDKWKELAEKENYLGGVQAEYNQLKAALIKDKKADLEKNKNEIKKILQAEIVTRYYYQKGRDINDMKEDEVLKEAVSVIQDSARMNKLLGR